MTQKSYLINIILFIWMFSIAIQTQAQIKIGKNHKTLNQDAIFEMESDTSGMILPRVKLFSSIAPNPLKAHVKGMMVYNLDTAGLAPNVVYPGIYYNDGTKWVLASRNAEGLIMKRVRLTSGNNQVISDPNTPADTVPIIATFEDTAGKIISVNITKRQANIGFTINTSTNANGGILNYAYPGPGNIIPTGPQGPPGPLEFSYDAATKSIITLTRTGTVKDTITLAPGFVTKRIKLNAGKIHTVSDPNTPNDSASIIATYEDTDGSIKAVNIIGRQQGVGFTIVGSSDLGKGYLNYGFSGISYDTTIKTGPQGPPGPAAVIGDIKSGIQSSDHLGWIKLDGRALSSLTATQQSAATALGLSGNLPDATNAFMLQNGQALATISGSNSRTIARNQLPNFTLGGTALDASAGTPSGTVSIANATSSMQSAGNHTHTMGVTYNNESGINSDRVNTTTNGSGPFEGVGSWLINSAGDHIHNMNPHSHGASFSGFALGNHTHGITTDNINGGVTQAAFDITPRTLSVNTFIFLGP